MGKCYSVCVLIINSIIFLISGCSVFESFSKTENVNLQLPAWPPTEVTDVGYPELSGWQLSLFSSDRTEHLFLSPEISSINKTLQKDDVLVVSARPVTLSCDGTYETLFFMPCGSSYPQLCHDGILKLTWEDGFASDIMKSIILNCEKDGYSREKARGFLVRFNWKKFSEVIKGKSSAGESDTAFYNPWKLDIQKTINSLTSGNFSATKLNLKAGIEIPFPKNCSMPPLSPYIPENTNIILKQTLPVYTNSENLFFFEKDLLYICFSEDGKKLSDTTVFMPKKTIETVYAKKN